MEVGEYVGRNSWVEGDVVFSRVWGSLRRLRGLRRKWFKFGIRK